MKIKDIASVQAGPFGSQLHKSEYENHGVPMLNAKNIGHGEILTAPVDYVTENICDRMPQYVLKYGDIVFGRAGSIDRHAFIDKEYDGSFQGTNCIRVRLHDLHSAKYLSYYLWLPTVKKHIENSVGGSIQAYISTEILNELEISIPETKTIETVTALLSCIDSKIQNNNKICAELEAMAKTIYDYWFVQFDFPDADGRPYRTSGGAMVWSDELKREVPEGWGVKLLGDLTEYVIDKSVMSLTADNYIGTDNMLPNMQGITQAEYIPDAYSSTSYRPTDILLSNIRPYFKKIWFSDRSGGCSADVLAIRSKQQNMAGFIYYALANDIFFRYDVVGSKGTKMPRGDKTHIMKFPIAFNYAYAGKYSEVAMSILMQCGLLRRESRELAALRDWLLPMLMNGQARVE